MEMKETTNFASKSARLSRRGALAGFGLAAGLLGAGFPQAAAALEGSPGSNVQAEATESLETARLEFRPVFEEWGPGRVRVELDGQGFYLGSERIGGEVVQWIDTSDGTHIRFELTDDGARQSEAMTREHLGSRLAVLYSGQVVATPTVRAVLGKRGEISLSEPLDFRRPRKRF